MQPKPSNLLRSLDYKKSTASALLITLSHCGVALAAAIVGAMSWRLHVVPALIISVFAVVVIGTRFRAINNMSHECIHGTFVSHAHANEVFGYIFAIVEFSSFQRFRREHATHHQHLGDYEKDLDFRGLEKFGFHDSVDGTAIKTHLRRAFMLRHVPTYAFIILVDFTEPGWARIMRVSYVACLLALGWFFTWPTLVFLVIPFATTYQIQKYLTDFLDHGGLLNNSDEIDKTRNFIVDNLILRLLFFPRNDCYHLVHHLRPSLAVESFHAAHALLLSDDRYKRLTHQAYPQIRGWFP